MDVFTPVVQAFRFYDDDAGEAASTPLANQDTNVTINVDAGNVPFQLRVRIQATTAVAGATTDDYALQRSHAGGAYATINGTTTAVLASASGLTNDAATTNRATNGITDGTGSFVASEQSSDGIVDNWQLTASNFTEMVWGGTVVAADVSNGQTITFRVSLNGGAPGMTNSVTPTITIQKAVSVALSGVSPVAVLGTGAVGSLAASVSLALSGNAGTGAVGSVGTAVSYSVALTGEAGTGSVGSLVPSFSLGLSGETGTGAVGTLGPTITVALSGEAGTGGIGDLTPSVAYSVALTSVLGTGAVDSFAPSISAAISGNEGTSGLGSFLASISAALTSNVALGDVGTLVPDSGGGAPVVTAFNRSSMAGGVTIHVGVSKPSLIGQDSTTKQYKVHDYKPDGVNRETYLVDGELP